MASWAGIPDTRPLKRPRNFRPLGAALSSAHAVLNTPPPSILLYFTHLPHFTFNTVTHLRLVSVHPLTLLHYPTWLVIEYRTKNGYRACLGTSHATHSKSVTAITGLSVSELAHTSLSVSARHDTTRVGSPGVVLGGHAVTCQTS